MASKGSQTPSQTLNCLVSAFYGWQKIFKKLPKNLINTEETTQTLTECPLEPLCSPYSHTLLLTPNPARFLTLPLGAPIPIDTKSPSPSILQGIEEEGYSYRVLKA